MDFTIRTGLVSSAAIGATVTTIVGSLVRGHVPRFNHYFAGTGIGTDREALVGQGGQRGAVMDVDESIVVVGTFNAYEARLAMVGGEMDVYITVAWFMGTLVIAVGILWGRGLLPSLF